MRVPLALRFLDFLLSLSCVSLHFSGSETQLKSTDEAAILGSQRSRNHFGRASDFGKVCDFRKVRDLEKVSDLENVSDLEKVGYLSISATVMKHQ